ncbi:phosphoribosylglycinamide formyltransferase [Butyrivibrio sp. VCB2006]|uniref:phosphoribosylglycinamide formyltransferase n=1 Tax=Butyrivibrio sp. VCB2006 TaxID=1280679 RepID=UPI00041B2345|nr:phosphoribosylglycinamide formyltransferase [Butyrivibrio sp. VCB2006]
MKIAVLVSGGGTNLQAIIDSIESGKITNTEICLVYSNNPNAYALERAKKAGIPTVAKSPKKFGSREEFNKALLQILLDAAPDLIVLAGCLVVIPREVVEAFPNRIINIHPSLIPAFCGTGYYGLKVHEKALERGVRVSGATVHFVDAGTDTGPIILQKPVMIEPGDTPEVLQKRIMEQAEWKIMPMAIDLIANGRVRVENGHAVIDGYDEVVREL